ncbi:hypothetical protein EDB86DRAFT_3077579 [Lactarius hatsudake]|nr:hypothetical protein EDB86DRAFT_3077579 [Lactarius hatsudake]
MRISKRSSSQTQSPKSRVLDKMCVVRVPAAFVGMNFVPVVFGLEILNVDCLIICGNYSVSSSVFPEAVSLSKFQNVRMCSAYNDALFGGIGGPSSTPETITPPPASDKAFPPLAKAALPPKPAGTAPTCTAPVKPTTIPSTVADGDGGVQQHEKMAATAKVTAAVQGWTPTGTLSHKPLPASPAKANVTKVVFICHGGFVNKECEQKLRLSNPGIIVQGVHNELERKTKKPIWLLYGHWSREATRTGNFIYVFTGKLTMSQITPYQEWLCAPFPGASLVPSEGWFWAQLRGVICNDAEGKLWDEGELEAELHLHPTFKTVLFIIKLHWLTHPNNIQDTTATVGFAMEDTNGTVIQAAMAGPISMFSYQVKFIPCGDSPTLIQCGCCHAIGHRTNDKACKCTPSLRSANASTSACSAATKATTHDPTNAPSEATFPPPASPKSLATTPCPPTRKGKGKGKAVRVDDDVIDDEAVNYVNWGAEPTTRGWGDIDPRDKATIEISLTGTEPTPPHPQPSTDLMGKSSTDCTIQHQTAIHTTGPLPTPVPAANLQGCAASSAPTAIDTAMLTWVANCLTAINTDDLRTVAHVHVDGTLWELDHDDVSEEFFALCLQESHYLWQVLKEDASVLVTSYPSQADYEYRAVRCHAFGRFRWDGKPYSSPGLCLTRQVPNLAITPPYAYSIASVNMGRRNQAMHVLLESNTQDDILCVQEPWFSRIGTSRADHLKEGRDILGGAANQRWELIYPFFSDDRQAKVMTYIRKHDTPTGKKRNGLEVIARLNLVQHPCILITDIRTGGKLWQVVNFYNDTADLMALCALMHLKISDEVPTLLVGDFNLHSTTWSPYGWAPTSGVGEFEGWAALNTLLLMNVPGKPTRRGVQAQNQRDSTIDLIWHNFAAEVHSTFFGGITDWPGSIGSNHTLVHTIAYTR